MARALRQSRPRGLDDRSHRPYTCPHATPAAVVQHILALQHRYRLGARKVRWLAKRVPADLVPTVATVHRILERHGRTSRRGRSRRRFHAGRPDATCDQPNAIWTADFKGQFRTGNGFYCYPLTVQDGATRFLLGCRALLEPTIEGSWPVFARLFRRYGWADAVEMRPHRGERRRVTTGSAHRYIAVAMRRTGETSSTRRLFAGFVLASFFLSFAPVPSGAQGEHHCPPPTGSGHVLSSPADHDCHEPRAGTCSGMLHCLGISAAAWPTAHVWNTAPSVAAAAPAAPPALHASPVAPPTPPPNN